MVQGSPTKTTVLPIMVQGLPTRFNVCLFVLILDVPSTIFQLYRDGSSWVEPALSQDKCVLLKDHNAVTPVRLEPAALQSRVKHSTIEPLRSLDSMCSQSRFKDHQTKIKVLPIMVQGSPIRNSVGIGRSLFLIAQPFYISFLET